MSESKHTPGPWEVHDGFYIGRPGRMSLAEVKSGDIESSNIEQHKANATLIAAAPELLKHLKLCHLSLCPTVHLDGLCDGCCIADVIAKAEGRTNANS